MKRKIIMGLCSLLILSMVGCKAEATYSTGDKQTDKELAEVSDLLGDELKANEKAEKEAKENFEKPSDIEKKDIEITKLWLGETSTLGGDKFDSIHIAFKFGDAFGVKSIEEFREKYQVNIISSYFGEEKELMGYRYELSKHPTLIQNYYQAPYEFDFSEYKYIFKVTRKQDKKIMYSEDLGTIARIDENVDSVFFDDMIEMIEDNELSNYNETIDFSINNVRFIRDESGVKAEVIGLIENRSQELYRVPSISLYTKGALSLNAKPQKPSVKPGEKLEVSFTTSNIEQYTSYEGKESFLIELTDTNGNYFMFIDNEKLSKSYNEIK